MVSYCKGRVAARKQPVFWRDHPDFGLLSFADSARTCLEWRTYGLVLGSGGRDGALGAAVAGVRGANDGDLILGWGVATLRVGGRESGKNKGDELGVHLEE
jgi:hypothetical protein